MAKEIPAQEVSFSAGIHWPQAPQETGDAKLDGSLGRLTILLGDVNLTEYQDDSGKRGQEIYLPLYYLAEWLAENWWALLNEPRKTDFEKDDSEFLSRHWMGWARSGFALPSVTFAPVGQWIEVTAKETYLRFAKLSFLHSFSGLVEPHLVETELSTFVEAVLERLSAKGNANTTAHSYWSRIKATSEEERLYCKLIGSMGLSPYMPHPQIDSILEQAGAGLGAQMLVDLCQASDAETLPRTASLADELNKQLDKVPQADLGTLAETCPEDSAPSGWQWGKSATGTLRTILGVAEDNAEGANKVFDQLSVNLNQIVQGTDEAASTLRVAGGVRRSENHFQLAVPSYRIEQRRFNAARGIFLAWSGTRKTERLVTSARTRDQQASRAFAAELLAPARFIRRRLGKNYDISSFVIDSIAEEIGVASTVVRYQAHNNGYFIYEAA